VVAEESRGNQKIARVMLEKLRLQVVVVGNGREAVTAWKSGGIDLILMDCQMPELDGYAATREIRRAEQGQRHIPIVALTAHAMKGDDEKCKAAGMDDYLTKPLDRGQLIACLERHLGQIGNTAVARTEEERSQTAAAPSKDDAPAPVDWPAFMQATDHDDILARELVDLFIA